MYIEKTISINETDTVVKWDIFKYYCFNICLLSMIRPERSWRIWKGSYHIPEKDIYHITPREEDLCFNESQLCQILLDNAPFAAFIFEGDGYAVM